MMIAGSGQPPASQEAKAREQALWFVQRGMAALVSEKYG